jgi:uncharacterized RDD family membrane protein YckC
MSSSERNSFGGSQYEGQTESHYIDTPEQVELEFNLAGAGSRFVAVLLDHLIVFAFFLVEFLVLLLVASAAEASSVKGDERAGKWALAILILLNFAVFAGYFAFFEAWWHGQTPGKKVMKLRVIKDSGRQITLFEALARELLRVVDYLPGLYLVGVITMMCNKRSKRLGDLAAGTIVIHERLDEGSVLYQTSTTLVAPVGFTSQPMGQEAVAPWGQKVTAMFPADAVARLDGKDLMVIETFFARMLDLPLETRAAVAYRMVGQMAAKMGVPVPDGNPERALEAMVYQKRGSGNARY